MRLLTEDNLNVEDSLDKTFKIDLLKSNWMNNREILEILKKFGLSEYESKVYTALAIIGPSKAGEISDQSNVPQSKVYEVLDQLANKQFVEIFDGRPKEFKAVSPEILIKNLVVEKEREIELLKNKTAEVKSFLKNFKSAEEISEGIWMTKSRKWFEFFDKISEMLEGAKKYVYAITRDFSYSSRLREAVKGCIRRNVDLHIMGMGSINENNYLRAKWYDVHGVKLKIFETKIHPRIVVVDGKEVQMRLDHNPLKKKFYFHSIWSEDPSLVFVIDAYMKNLWKSAQPLDFSKIRLPKLS